MSRLKTLSPSTKLWFVLSLLALLLWVIPTMVSFYKNQKLYNQKVSTLELLDKRENGQIDAKTFHSEVFKVDAKEYFDEVTVVSVEDNSYEITLIFPRESISKFHSFLKNISLNYKVSVQDNIIYEDIGTSFKVIMTVKPF